MQRRAFPSRWSGRGLHTVLSPRSTAPIASGINSFRPGIDSAIRPPARRLCAEKVGSTRAVRHAGGSDFMATIQHSTNGSSLAEVVDRILDRGCVIDAFVRVTLVGIELLAIEARVVIASVDTWLKYAEAVGLTTTFEQTSELQS